MNWPFADPKNVAVYTTRQIVDGESSILWVSHDADDGAWQFIGSAGVPEDLGDARLVGLGTIVNLDPSVLELCDLPEGWVAWRDSASEPWRRMRRG